MEDELLEHYKNVEITFYRDNRKDEEHKVKAETIVNDFLESEIFKSYLKGLPFYRALLNFMSDKYGSFDTLTDEQIDAIHAVKCYELINNPIINQKREDGND